MYEKEIETLQKIIDRCKKEFKFDDDACKIFINHEKANCFESIIKALHLLEKYQELGTIEEINHAMELQIPKTPKVKPWSPARCPSCGTELSHFIGDGIYRHSTFLERCPNPDCAQRLNWTGIKE